MKVILDTNFLLTTIRYKLHGLSQIKERFPAEFYVLSGSIDELEGLAKNNKKIAKEYKLVKEMLHNEKAIGIKSSTENVDNELVELSKEYIIATNDKELRNRIKESGGKTIFIKKLTFVDMSEIE
jgi:rRNA-processing protein FCF1